MRLEVSTLPAREYRLGFICLFITLLGGGGGALHSIPVLGSARLSWGVFSLLMRRHLKVQFIAHRTSPFAQFLCAARGFHAARKSAIIMKETSNTQWNKQIRKQ